MADPLSSEAQQPVATHEPTASQEPVVPQEPVAPPQDPVVPQAPVAPQAPITADEFNEPEHDGESDSAMGDEVSEYTISLTSSIQKFITENGRRYHAYKDQSYWLPNDDSELDRLDLMHQMFKMLVYDKLHLAPIETNKPLRVLDVGTGTGIWAVEFGDEYPLADIIGTDLSPTQSTWVPPNVKFEVDDCEEPWTFQRPFDYIHIRYMIGSVKDWPKLARQAYKHTTHGGWAEFQDFDSTYYSEDGSWDPNNAFATWVNGWRAAAEQSGGEYQPGHQLAGWMHDAGFVNIKHEKFRVPIGPWPKDKHLKTIGAWNMVQLEDGLEAFTLRLYTQYLGWKPEEVQILLAKVRKDLANPRIHSMYDYHVVYGQKPFDDPNA